MLRSNKFDKIDGDLLASLVSLTELDFSDNAVAVFPKKLCRLGKLTRLDLSRNKLWFVPKEIRSLGELKFFHLHENRLKTADMSRAEVATLKALEVLTLHDNYLEELPPEFADLPRLRKLTLSHNPCAAEVHAALAPFVDGLRVRATHLSVSAAAFRPPSPRRHAAPHDDSYHSPSPRPPHGGACSPHTDEGGRYYTGRGNSGGWATCSSSGRATSGRWAAASPPSRALFPERKLPAPALRRSASAEHLPPYYSNSSSPASSPSRLRDPYVRERFSPACSPACSPAYSPRVLPPVARGAWYDDGLFARA